MVSCLGRLAVYKSRESSGNRNVESSNPRPNIPPLIDTLTPHYQRLTINREMLRFTFVDHTGRPSFTGLQERHRHIATGDAYALAYYVFDLLELKGRSWRRQPLAARRRRLASLIRGEVVLLSMPLPGTVDEIVRQVRAHATSGVSRYFTALSDFSDLRPRWVG